MTLQRIATCAIWIHHCINAYIVVHTSAMRVPLTMGCIVFLVEKVEKIEEIRAALGDQERGDVDPTLEAEDAEFVVHDLPQPVFREATEEGEEEYISGITSALRSAGGDVFTVVSEPEEEEASAP